MVTCDILQGMKFKPLFHTSPSLLTLLVGLSAQSAFAAKLPVWKIVYGAAEGPEGRAIELITSDVGEILLREPGVYATHVMSAWAATADPATNGNAFVLGTLENNGVLRRYLKSADVPKGGYRVKTIAEKDRDLVLIAGDSCREVLWGAADFLTFGLAALRPDLGNHLSYFEDVFLRGGNRLGTLGNGRTNLYDVARAPETKVRSVFTWGHPIDDYRAYIRNLARLRINRLYLWNNYPVLNAREIVDYAHSWGVEVFWGFAWGWGLDCAKLAERNPDGVAESILKEWRTVWRDVPGDGIYFQTFTECGDQPLANGESIAARAVKLVNRVAARMFEEKPSQKIVFGLHASGVKAHLSEIAATDPRLEILWEDTGYFPYNANGRIGGRPIPADEGEALTWKVLTNDRREVGIVWKFQMIQDWTNWTYQEGPFLLGVTSRKTYDDDVAIQSRIWRNYDLPWIERFREAHGAARRVHALGDAIEMNIAAQLNGPIRWPTLFVADLFWSTKDDAETVFRRAQSARLPIGR